MMNENVPLVSLQKLNLSLEPIILHRPVRLYLTSLIQISIYIYIYIYH